MEKKYRHRYTGDIVEVGADRYYHKTGEVSVPIPAKYIEGCSDWIEESGPVYEITALYQEGSDGKWTYPVIDGLVRQSNSTTIMTTLPEASKVEKGKLGHRT